MNLGQMRTAVKTKLRIGSTTDALLGDSTLTTLINEALRKFSKQRDWPWLVTSASVSISTSGTASLPTGFYKAIDLIYDEAPVQWVGLDELLQSQNRYVWTTDGTTVRVEPEPSATTAMTLWYYKFEPDLSGDSDLPLAPTIYHDLIVLWAAHLGSVARRDYEAANQFAVDYDREAKEAAEQVFRKKGNVRVALRSERRSFAPRWS